MSNRKCSASSRRWLEEHFNDQYVKKAKKKKVRSRSWFKLDEIQKSENFLKPGMTVIDLGSSPGGWSQYAMSKIGGRGRIIACDLLPMAPISGVDFIQGDFRDKSVMKSIMRKIGDSKVQAILSDMAPNMCGKPAIDSLRTIYLVDVVLKMCRDVLALNGTVVTKVFQGSGFEEYLQTSRSLFTKVTVRKPNSSRTRSREMYIVAAGRK